MNRRIAALTIGTIALLGLAGCSAGSSPESGTESTTQAEAPASAQSVTEACDVVMAKIQDASTAMAGIDYTTAGADAQATIDAFTVTVDGIGEAADSVSNEEVKSATVAVHEDYVALRDLMTKVLVDGDVSVSTDLTTVTTDMQTSAQALTTLCTS